MKKVYEVMPYIIVDGICEYMGVGKDELKSKTRKRRVVFARMLVSYVFLFYRYTDEEIGMTFINRDRTTVQHHKKCLLNEKDVFLVDKIRGLVSFFGERGIELPTYEEFRKRVFINSYDYGKTE